MERRITFAENEYYHLYNRGVEKRVLFSSMNDYRRFMILLYLANDIQDIRLNNMLRSTSYNKLLQREREDPLIAIGAFCIMPNHFHLLVTPRIENGISRYMLKLQTAYSMYFNIKNDRSGALFQRPFRSTHVDSDQYLKYLYSYIHLNPAKLKEPQWKEGIWDQADLLKFVESYPYSSYNAYLESFHTITDPTRFPNYFSSKKEVTTNITDWLATEE